MILVPLLFPLMLAASPPHPVVPQPSRAASAQRHATTRTSPPPPPKLVYVLIPAHPSAHPAIRIDTTPALTGATTAGGVLLDTRMPSPNMYVCRRWQCMNPHRH